MTPVLERLASQREQQTGGPAKETSSAREEWAKYWPLPCAAALGYSAAGLHVFGIGPFIAPIQHEFGWTRAAIVSGTTIVSAAVGLTGIPVGWLIDRWGPRPIGLVGVLAIGAAVAMLGTTTGTTTNWVALWLLPALAAPLVQSSIWISAVVTRFETSRGLAMGVTLCGSAIATFVLPLLATGLIARTGWRHAFMGMGGIWALLLFPILFLFFRGARDGNTGRSPSQPATAPAADGHSLAECLRTGTFYKLTIATALFVTAIYGAIINMVPILTDQGISSLAAASAASLAGICSLVGRLSTGVILDRFPARLVGATMFLLPIPGCLLLINANTGIAGHVLGAALFGFTLGAETDSITYLAARHFGPRNFG